MVESMVEVQVAAAPDSIGQAASEARIMGGRRIRAARRRFLGRRLGVVSGRVRRFPSEPGGTDGALEGLPVESLATIGSIG